MKKATGTDKLVGERIRICRNQLQLSQKTLAERLGVTIQQIQKYETGINRISSEGWRRSPKYLGCRWLTYSRRRTVKRCRRRLHP